MVMEDLIDSDVIVSLEKTPFEWLLEASDESFRSLAKENTLGIIVFGLYFYVVFKLMQLALMDPAKMWPWFWQFMAQFVMVFFIAWMALIRWKGGSSVLDVDFYKPDGTRASGIVMLKGQPMTVSIGFLEESIEGLRESYERIRSQRIRKLRLAEKEAEKPGG